MRSSPYIRQIIKSFEGFEPTAKPDPGRGLLTVGWGHTATAQKYVNRKIDLATAERLFLSDVREAEKKIESFETKNRVQLTPAQFDALVSFVFNTGYLPASIQNRILKLSGRPVAQTLRLYNKAENRNGQLQVLPGLTKRRTIEANRFNQTKNIFWFSFLLILLSVRK